MLTGVHAEQYEATSSNLQGEVVHGDYSVTPAAWRAGSGTSVSSGLSAMGLPGVGCWTTNGYEKFINSYLS